MNMISEKKGNKFASKFEICKFIKRSLKDLFDYFIFYSSFSFEL
jgi:hypothetical protein